MRAQRHTKVIAIIALLFLVGCVGVYGFSVHKLLTLKQYLEKEQQAAALIQTEALDRNNLQRLLTESEAERNELRGYVIEQKDIIDFLALVEALGRTHGATVSTLSLNVTSKSDTLDELQVSIAASGSKEAVLHVLSLLETLPYQSYVQSAVVTERPDTNSRLWNGTFVVAVTKHPENDN